VTPERVVVVLPARDEGPHVAAVVADFHAHGFEVVVVDNDSSDDTAARAREAGATVVLEPRPGYGSACRSGAEAALASGAGWVLFSDCDGTCRGEDARQMVEVAGDADLVLGRRAMVAPGALDWRHRLGNRCLCWLLRIHHGVRVSDVPPLRAVRAAALRALELRDPGVGYPVETIARAGRLGLRIREVPVSYHNRAGGESRVARTMRDALRVGRTMARCIRSVR